MGCENSWKLETEVRYILKKNNINFEEQKKFDWLKNRGKLSLDFFLPDYNIFIECQGRQHFIPVEKYGGVASFEESFNRDKIKYDLCISHGLKPIYYSLVRFEDTFLGEKIINNEEDLINKIKNG